MLRVFSREATAARSPWRQPGVNGVLRIREPRSGDSNENCEFAVAASRLTLCFPWDLRADARSYVLPPLSRLKMRNIKKRQRGRKSSGVVVPKDVRPR